MDSLPSARVLLLVSYRPEYQHNWGSKTYYRQLRIDPLPPKSADELLDATLGDDAALESLKRLLIERTEGNPLLLEETVRTLVETHVLAGERGAYRLFALSHFVIVAGSRESEMIRIPHAGVGDGQATVGREQPAFLGIFGQDCKRDRACGAGWSDAGLLHRAAAVVREKKR